ncbi:uncharacterized protein LOC123704960 isoform X2 [Colias croceus]|uniref:uncharacterized protein LOC123704960 isoform X2 n=1 Tax=Colias crocea TaxID=72248 RepID=UPI001E27D65B|nr:uncharacterized protein LOC123704960 isoform X2 [Colias croceus]
MTQSCATDFSTFDDIISFWIYLNENTPADYQAPGFMCMEEEDHLEPTINKQLKLGSVETPFHKIVAHSFFKEPMRASHKPTENPPVPVVTNDMELTGVTGSAVRLCCPCNMDVPCDTFTQSELVSTVISDSMRRALELRIDRHLASQVMRHCLSNCYDLDPTRTPTDTQLVSLSLRRREYLSLFRRTLELCSEVQTIKGWDLIEKFKIFKFMAAQLMKLLDSNKIIQRDSESSFSSPGERCLHKEKSCRTKEG